MRLTARQQSSIEAYLRWELGTTRRAVAALLDSVKPNAEDLAHKEEYERWRREQPPDGPPDLRTMPHRWSTLRDIERDYDRISSRFDLARTVANSFWQLDEHLKYLDGTLRDAMAPSARAYRRAFRDGDLKQLRHDLEHSAQRIARVVLHDDEEADGRYDGPGFTIEGGQLHAISIFGRDYNVSGIIDCTIALDDAWNGHGHLWPGRMA